MFKSINDLPMLTVCVLEGPTFGGGTGIVCMCDYVVVMKKEG